MDPVQKTPTDSCLIRIYTFLCRFSMPKSKNLVKVKQVKGYTSFNKSLTHSIPRDCDACEMKWFITAMWMLHPHILCVNHCYRLNCVYTIALLKWRNGIRSLLFTTCLYGIIWTLTFKRSHCQFCSRMRIKCNRKLPSNTSWH